jgi:hypothetical protein
MNIAVSHPSFVKQQLAVRPAGWLSGPRVLLNSVTIKSSKGIYVVRNDAGAEVSVRLKSTFVDPIPTLTLDDEKVALARKLKWYEYVWIGIPILLIFTGGALGAGIGVFAFYSSSRIIRSDRSTTAKYILTGVISVCAFGAFVIAVTAFRAMIAASRQ